jgi:hypothetical protein
MKGLSVVWFSGRDCIGIVKVDRDINPDFDAWYYIGVARGGTPEGDMLDIAKYGTAIPIVIGDVVFATLSEYVQECPT